VNSLNIIGGSIKFDRKIKDKVHKYSWMIDSKDFIILILDENMY
jgi:uncharacterized protein with WD repeat